MQVPDDSSAPGATHARRSPAERHAVIVGAGIGGLTTAAALRRIGWKVTIVERAAQPRGIGAGISMWPNAVNALATLGLRPAIDASGVAQHDARFHTWEGRPIGALVADRVGGVFGAPLLMIHRAALQRLLLTAAAASDLRLGASCTQIAHDTSGAAARLDDRTWLSGEILIGADGIDSTARNALFGLDPPRYSGYTAWRGVVPIDDALASRLLTGEFLGRGALFGIARLGGSQVYWWASQRCPYRDGEGPEREKTELLDHFGRWVDPIPELLDATQPETIIRSPLSQRSPVHTLSIGRIALVGDAAHPMMPTLGQGGCQAIEDAVELADALHAEPDITTALARYGSRRAPRTAAIARRAYQIMRAAHLRNPIAVGLRNGAMRATPTSMAIKRISPILGYRVRALHPVRATGRETAVATYIDRSGAQGDGARDERQPRRASER